MRKCFCSEKDGSLHLTLEVEEINHNISLQKIPVLNTGYHILAGTIRHVDMGMLRESFQTSLTPVCYGADDWVVFHSMLTPDYCVWEN